MQCVSFIAFLYAAAVIGFPDGLSPRGRLAPTKGAGAAS